MRECDVWKRETDEEFENSMEAMEKLVMNRIYDLCAITLNRQTRFDIRLIVLSRLRLLHSDTKLQRTIWNGIRFSPNVFDCSNGSKRSTSTSPPVITTLDSSASHSRVRHLFLRFGNSSTISTELLKINHYKAPRDKIICILNCCKVIFGAYYSM